MGKSDKPLREWDYTFVNDQREYIEPYVTTGYAKGGSQINGDAGYAQLKLGAVRALMSAR